LRAFPSKPIAPSRSTKSVSDSSIAPLYLSSGSVMTTGAFATGYAVAIGGQCPRITSITIAIALRFLILNISAPLSNKKHYH
jgi:hypothetical protein